MEKRSMIGRLLTAFKTMLAYGCQHAGSLSMMDSAYTRCSGNMLPDNPATAILRIRPCGQLYEITRGSYENGQFRVSEKWLATYGWHSTGHLIAIGRTLYIIFDPIRKLVLVEHFPDDGPVTLETYHQI
ncbi:hypothetical protein [Mucilaginibacter conchicola]|nr:hypothetical protein [Mucilaginibacter conchicola]